MPPSFDPMWLRCLGAARQQLGAAALPRTARAELPRMPADADAGRCVQVVGARAYPARRVACVFVRTLKTVAKATNFASTANMPRPISYLERPGGLQEPPATNLIVARDSRDSMQAAGSPIHVSGSNCVCEQQRETVSSSVHCGSTAAAGGGGGGCCSSSQVDAAQRAARPAIARPRS